MKTRIIAIMYKINGHDTKKIHLRYPLITYIVMLLLKIGSFTPRSINFILLLWDKIFIHKGDFVLISPRQIRAARGLLGWDYAELCKRTDFHRHTVRNIESGATQPQPGTMERIAQVFTDAGIEFLEHNGLRLKPASVDMLVGQEGLRRFFDNVYEHARLHGGTIMQFGVDEQTFLDHLGAEFSQDYLKRMTDLSRERRDLEVLAIICEGDTRFLASDYNKYRWISKEVFQAVPFYICGETLAIMDFQTHPGPTVVLLKSRAITSAYRKQFEAFWKMATTPPQPRPAAKRSRRRAKNK